MKAKQSASCIGEFDRSRTPVANCRGGSAINRVLSFPRPGVLVYSRNVRPAPLPLGHVRPRAQGQKPPARHRPVTGFGGGLSPCTKMVMADQEQQERWVRRRRNATLTWPLLNLSFEGQKRKIGDDRDTDGRLRKCGKRCWITRVCLQQLALPNECQRHGFEAFQICSSFVPVAAGTRS